MTSEEAKVRAWGRRESKKWDASPEGRSNSSSLYRHVVEEVERLIRGDAHALLNGRANMTAGLIVAQLAHVHGLRPGNKKRCKCGAE